MMPGHTRKRSHQIIWAVLARLRPLLLPALILIYAGCRAAAANGAPGDDIAIGAVLAAGAWLAPVLARSTSEHGTPRRKSQICPLPMLGPAQTRPYHQE